MRRKQVEKMLKEFPELNSYSISHRAYNETEDRYELVHGDSNRSFHFEIDWTQSPQGKIIYYWGSKINIYTRTQITKVNLKDQIKQLLTLFGIAPAAADGS